MQESTTLTDQNLLRRIALGDERAFENLYRNYAPRLLPFIDRMIRLPDMAEEILQDIFVQLWIKRTLLAGVINPQAYLFHIAANRVLDYQRKIASDKRLKARMLLGAQHANLETEERVNYNERAAMVQQAIEQLPTQRRRIFELSRLEGFSHEQIADRLQLSKQTVANQMGAALRSVKAFLANKGLLIFLLTCITVC